MNIQRGWLWFLSSFIILILVQSTFAIPLQERNLTVFSYAQISKKPSSIVNVIPIQPSLFEQSKIQLDQESLQQLLAYEQSVNAYLAIKQQEPRCSLSLTNGKVLVSTLQIWQQELEQIKKINNDQELVERYQKRILTLANTPLFKNGYVLNSDLESLLLHELKTTYNKAQLIALEYPQVGFVRQAVPTIYKCAQAAVAQSDVSIAFSYADAAHSILAIMKRGISFLAKTSQTLVDCGVKSKLQHAIDRGLLRGLKEVLTIEHWKELSKVLQHSFAAVKKGASFIAHQLLEEAQFEHLLDGQNEPYREQFLKTWIEQKQQECESTNAVVRQHWNELHQMPWDDLVTYGVQKGFALLFDLTVFDGAALVAQASGRKLLAEIAMVCKSSDASFEAYCVEVAGVGKGIVQEPKTLERVIKVLEKQPEISISENIINKIGKKFEKHTTKIQALIKEQEMLLGKELLAQNQIEQLRIFGTLEKKAIFEMQPFLTPIYKISGGYEQALIDFEQLKLLNVCPMLDKDGFIGYMYDGRSVIVRRLSTFDSRPTLEIQEFLKNGNTNYIKYRYGEK